jgi:hypothetical protein
LCAIAVRTPTASPVQTARRRIKAARGLRSAGGVGSCRRSDLSVVVMSPDDIQSMTKLSPLLTWTYSRMYVGGFTIC